MAKHILITGGAGFVGSQLCDRLLTAGHKLRVVDNLSPPESRPISATITGSHRVGVIFDDKRPVLITGGAGFIEEGQRAVRPPGLEGGSP